jgi:hypothetical protein
MIRKLTQICSEDDKETAKETLPRVGKPSHHLSGELLGNQIQLLDIW